MATKKVDRMEVKAQDLREGDILWPKSIQSELRRVVGVYEKSPNSRRTTVMTCDGLERHWLGSVMLEIDCPIEGEADVEESQHEGMSTG